VIPDRKEAHTNPMTRSDIEEIARTHLHAALEHDTPLAVWTAVADIPLLLAEIDRLRILTTSARRQFADLLAAGRATLAAHHDGEDDPLSYLRDEINAHSGDDR
jgi:hypothetical protein